MSAARLSAATETGHSAVAVRSPAAIVISQRLIIVSRLRHYRRDYYGVAYAFRNGDAGWRQSWLYIRFCSERYFALGQAS